MDEIIRMLPESIASHLDPSLGAFAVAFVLVKLTGPFRLMIDVAIAPTLAAYLRNTSLAGPLGLRKSAEMAGVAQGAGKPDSYRAVQRLVKPLAEAGRERLKARARSAVANTRARWQRLGKAVRSIKPGGGGRPGRAGHGPGVK